MQSKKRMVLNILLDALPYFLLFLIHHFIVKQYVSEFRQLKMINLYTHWISMREFKFNLDVFTITLLRGIIIVKICLSRGVK